MEPHTELYNQLFNQATLMHYQRAQQSTEPLVVGEFNKTVFDDRYQRNNKRGGLKNLRCFPSHSAEHRERGFCGQPVVVKVRRTHANVVIPEIYCWSEFVKVDDASATSVKAGDRVSHNQVLSVERDKDDRTRPWMRGELVHDDTTDDCIAFEFNRQRWGWHYGWTSNKHACNNSHALQCYVFQPVSPGSDTLVCLAVFQSPHFILYCRRRRRFKNKTIGAVAATGVINDEDDDGGDDDDDQDPAMDSQNGSMPCSPEGGSVPVEVTKVKPPSKKKAAVVTNKKEATRKKDKKRKSPSSTTGTTTKTKTKKSKKDKKDKTAEDRVKGKSTKSKTGEKKAKKVKPVAVVEQQQQQQHMMDNLTQWTTGGQQQQQQQQTYQHHQMMMNESSKQATTTPPSNDAQATAQQQRLPDYHYQYQQQQQQQHLQQLLQQQQQQQQHQQQQQQHQQQHLGLSELDDPRSDLRSALDLSSANNNFNNFNNINNNNNNNISSLGAQDTQDMTSKAAAASAAAAAALSGHGMGNGMVGGIGIGSTAATDNNNQNSSYITTGTTTTTTTGSRDWMNGPVSNVDPFEAAGGLFDAWGQQNLLQTGQQLQQQDTPPSTGTATPSAI